MSAFELMSWISILLLFALLPALGMVAVDFYRSFKRRKRPPNDPPADYIILEFGGQE